MPGIFGRRLNLVLEAFNAEHLNPKIWDGDHVKADVRERLLQIAADFASDHDISKGNIDDIVLTGSMANFNWSEHSDIDLHLIVDPREVSGDQDLAKEFFKLAKSLWNKEHDITMCGHDVEIYLQATDEPHYASGVYSLERQRWIRKPDDSNVNPPDEDVVRRRAKRFEDEIKTLSDTDGPAATKLKEKIKKMRRAGLAKNGEFSVENLTFKHLRNTGALDKLAKIEVDAYDDSMSLNQCRSGHK